MPQSNHPYSPEAEAILGKIPSWIVRWGVTVVAAIFVGILVGCYFIKYPDLVQAPVVITTVNPPADLYARYDGLIDSIYVRDGEVVEKGRLVAVLHNAADRRDVARLEEQLNGTERQPYAELAASPWFAAEYNLGEVQSVFADFQSKCRDYRHYLETDLIGRKQGLLRQQIAKNREYYTKLQRQQVLLGKDLDYQHTIHRRDSLLLSEAVISSADYETSSQNLLQKQNSSAGFEATLTSTELQIIQNEQQIVELALQRDNEVAEHERGLSAARQQLLAQLAQWRQQYALEAPAAGCVTLVSYWSQNQRVKVGDKLASIVPDGTTQVIGRMQVPSAGFGKVEVGQTVNVKLNGYPYMEFGVLKGTISSISAVPEQIQTQNGTAIAYVAEIVFTDGMRTTYKKELPMIQQMDGTGEIITKDMRLIGRFFNPIRALFNK